MICMMDLKDLVFLDLFLDEAPLSGSIFVSLGFYLLEVGSVLLGKGWLHRCMI